MTNKMMKWLLFISIYFLINLGLFSCKNYDVNNEVREIDSLISGFNSAKKVLVIDDQFIQQRIDSMKIKIQFIDKLDANRMNAEFKYDISRYKALLKNYEIFIDKYRALTFDNQKYLSTLSSMKAAVIDKKLSKADFQKSLPKWRSVKNLHLSESKSTVRNLIGIEKMFERINNKITGFIYKQTQIKK